MCGFKQLPASDLVAFVGGIFCLALMENFSSHLERDRERADIGEDQAGLSGLVHISFQGAYAESLQFY